MKDTEFKQWLNKKYTNKGTIDSRIINCRLVEHYYPDLDSHFIKDKCSSVLEALSYSKSDEREKRIPNHPIPINGNVRNGSATLKQAVKLYSEFCKSQNEQNLDSKF